MDFFTNATAIAALAVVVVQEVLKLKIVPSQVANRYPVPTNIVLSVGASLIVVWVGKIHPVGVNDWLLLLATVSVSAAIVYNALLAGWSQLKSMQG